jgi:uncharacterized protein
VQPVPFTAVQCTDAFWVPRIETNRAATVPFAFAQCEKTGRVDLFKRAAQAPAGDPSVDCTPPRNVFDDADSATGSSTRAPECNGAGAEHSHAGPVSYPVRE